LEALLIEKTKSTPEIYFDAAKNILSINGESYPENSFRFFEPILDWLDKYFNQIDINERVVLDLSLPYINTSSSKCIMMLLEKCELIFKKGLKLTVNWLCDKDNESELECAEEFKEFVDIEFNIIFK